jgi:hypothetical protein
MRRMMIFAAAVVGSLLVGQSAFAGSDGQDDCSSAKCNRFSAVARKLGFSYFCDHSCGSGCGCGNGYGYGYGYGCGYGCGIGAAICGGGVVRCPPVPYPNRAPRDFWMLH